MARITRATPERGKSSVVRPARITRATPERSKSSVVRPIRNNRNGRRSQEASQINKRIEVKHKKNHYKYPKKICDLCGKNFSTTYTLARHISRFHLQLKVNIYTYKSARCNSWRGGFIWDFCSSVIWRDWKGPFRMISKLNFVKKINFFKFSIFYKAL